MIAALIQSLTTPEKRYISQRIASKKQHHELFQTIVSTGAHHNRDLESLLGDRSYFPIINTIKNQLYNMILDELREYNREDVMEIHIKKELGNVEILYSKKLLDHALKRLRKLKEFCTVNERLGYLLEVINLEMFILFEAQTGLEFEADIQRIYAELRHTNELAQEQFLYKLTYLRAINLIDNHIELVKPSKLNPEKERRITLDSSRYYYNHTRLIWSLQLKRYDIAKKASDKLVKMVARFPNELKKNKRQYIDVLFGCVMANVYTANFDEAAHHLNLMAEVHFSGGYDEIRRRERYVYGCALNKVHQARYEELDEEKAILENESDSFNPIFSQRTFLVLAYAAIKEGNYREAKYWCNSILFQKKKDIHIENFKKAIYADLYICLAQGNIDLFDKNIHFAYRRLKSVDNAGQAKWFKQLLREKDPAPILAEKLELLLV